MPQAIQDRFLTPNPADKQVVVLTDKEGSAAVMASRSKTTVLSAEALRILRMSFMEGEPAKLRAIVRTRIPEDIDFATAWIDESVEQGLFRLTATRPKVTDRGTKDMRAGSWISVTGFREQRGVQVEHPGRLETKVVGTSSIFWYTANVDLSPHSALLGLASPSAITVAGPVSARMRTVRVPGGVGANCNVCTVCGGCGACGGCALCGGVDFAAAALALVAVDAALTVTNAASTFEVLRRG